MTRIDFEQLGTHLRQDHTREWDTDAAWADLQTHVRRRARRPFLALAALLVIAAGIGITWQQWQDRNARVPASIVASYQTAIGQRRSVQLSDGSQVELATASTLRVIELSASRRIVELAGQAFFTVTHDAERPFIVRALDSETRVLGTSFDVSAYQDAAHVDVVVATGRVELRSTATRKVVVLVANQLGRLERGQLTVQGTNASDATLWRRGQLSFSDARFADVATALQRWYGVQIEIRDPALQDARVNLFLPHQSIDEALDVIAETFDARYERAGNRISFYRE